MTVIDEFKQMLDEPSLYLKKHFDAIRNEVELRVAQQEAKQEILGKINEFECKLLDNITLNNPIISEIKENLNSVEIFSNENYIKCQETKLGRLLFGNKTIIFSNDGKLAIINDEFISNEAFQQRKTNAKHVLTSELIKVILVENRLKSINSILEENLNLANLKELNLCANQINELDENAFQGLERLELLDLHNNELTRINENAFNGLANLKTLYLNGNPLEQINEKAFEGLNKLKKLFLDGDSVHLIAQINENNFDNLKLIKVFNSSQSFNQFTTDREN